MKTIYISGPITGMKNGNKVSFDYLAQIIKNNGDLPINPLDLGANISDSYPDFRNLTVREQWQIYMRFDIRELVMSDMVVVLDGWGLSEGSKIEVELAEKLGIPVVSMQYYVQKLK